jgi:myosin heavy subunit
MSNNSDIHFIRCIKPNEAKLPLTFVERVCYNQIRYLGVLDTVRMRKDCYHVRMPFSDFYKKFGILKGDVKEVISVVEGKQSEK